MSRLTEKEGRTNPEAMPVWRFKLARPPMVEFWVPGPPHGKERAQGKKGQGGYYKKKQDPLTGKWYCPQKDYEEKVYFMASIDPRSLVASSYAGRPFVSITISPKRNKDGTISKQVPDGDNVFKSIADACEGLLWQNDKEIKGHACCEDDGCPKPGVLVEVWWM